ncbi:MAG TPA: hypothetical protein PK423_04260 [Clostridiales bacterium]|nr:hypothetical protein [Clostridiales bacterium]HPZ05229.1 hypothetical protein [Clostridiales bacterium]
MESRKGPTDEAKADKPDTGSGQATVDKPDTGSGQTAADIPIPTGRTGEIAEQDRNTEKL